MLVAARILLVITLVSVVCNEAVGDGWIHGKNSVNNRIVSYTMLSDSTGRNLLIFACVNDTDFIVSMRTNNQVTRINEVEVGKIIAKSYDSEYLFMIIDENTLEFNVSNMKSELGKSVSHCIDVKSTLAKTYTF